MERSERPHLDPIRANGSCGDMYTPTLAPIWALSEPPRTSLDYVPNGDLTISKQVTTILQ